MPGDRASTYQKRVQRGYYQRERNYEYISDRASRGPGRQDPLLGGPMLRPSRDDAILPWYQRSGLVDRAQGIQGYFFGEVRPSFGGAAGWHDWVDPAGRES